MNIIITAYEKGFRVTKDGKLLNPKREVLSPHKNKSGYYIFSYRFKNKVIQCKVHRLQAFQKYGDSLFEKGIVTRHLNNVSTDNSEKNIAIGTQKDNIMDMPEQERTKKALHASSFIRKYNKFYVQDYHNLNGKSYKKTMQFFNISSKGTLHYLLNN